MPWGMRAIPEPGATLGLAPRENFWAVNGTGRHFGVSLEAARLENCGNIQLKRYCARRRHTLGRGIVDLAMVSRPSVDICEYWQRNAK